MNLTREEAIERTCKIVGMAYHSVADYKEPSDGFCVHCWQDAETFRNSGKALDYVEQAVREKLIRDGYKVIGYLD